MGYDATLELLSGIVMGFYTVLRLCRTLDGAFATAEGNWAAGRLPSALMGLLTGFKGFFGIRFTELVLIVEGCSAQACQKRRNLSLALGDSDFLGLGV